MLRLAFASGDQTEAAHRLAALWALGSDDELLGELGPMVLSTDRGRAAFVRLLKSDPRWAPAFHRRAPRLLGPALSEQVLAETGTGS